MNRPDPVELVAIAIPLLCEAAAVLMCIALMVTWVALGSRI